MWPAPSGSENALDIENKSEQDNKSAVGRGICWRNLGLTINANLISARNSDDTVVCLFLSSGDFWGRNYPPDSDLIFITEWPIYSTDKDR